MKQTTDIPRTYVSEEEAAQYLGLSRVTLRRWRWIHQGPAWVRLGGTIRYRLADLDEYAMSRRFDPAKGLAVDLSDEPRRSRR